MKEIASTGWPSVTASFLADHEKLAASHKPEELNQALFALVRLRKTINDARLACYQVARQHFKDNPEVHDRLLSIASMIEQEHARFPLMVIGQPLCPHAREDHEWVEQPVGPEVPTEPVRKRATRLERVLSQEEVNGALHKVMQSLVNRKH